MPRKMKKVLPPSTARVIMRKPDDLSELAQYVYDHQDDEPSTLEIVRVFQDGCKHRLIPLAKSGNYTGVLTIDVCSVCGATRTLGKPVEK